MTTNLVVQSIVWWFIILAFAIGNGALREKFLVPRFGLRLGQFFSGLLLCSIIFGIAYLAVPHFGVARERIYGWIGLFWLISTLAFEFTFGLLVQRKTLSEVLQAYAFRKGNIWPLVLVVTFIAPWLAAGLRGFF